MAARLVPCEGGLAGEEEGEASHDRAPLKGM